MNDTTSAAPSGAQGAYDFWLGLLPKFLAQMGASATPGATPAAPFALPFPVDQVAKAAELTQQALQSLAQNYTPMLQAAGAPGLLAQWAAALPAMGTFVPQPGAAQATAPFSAWMGAMPTLSGLAGSAANSGALMPFQQMQQAWLDLGSRLVGTTPQTYTAAFDRTYGALSDALGFGPLRRLQGALQEMAAAAAAQNEARAGYAMLIQSAFAAGMEGLLQRLAEMAQKGERLDSVLALLRLWATQTEDAVHRTLQSEGGLAATAALTRAGLAYRMKMRAAAAIVADACDMATRHDLDEAFREIQELKRELRRRARPSAAPAAKPAARRMKGKAK
jgi:hypothetical protein